MAVVYLRSDDHSERFGAQAMGIKFDNQRVNTSGVSDRRGRGGPVAIGGGAGVVGLVIYLLVSVLGGGEVDTTGLVPQDGQVQGQGAGTGDLETRCNEQGAIQAHDDCFLVKVYNEINEVWTCLLYTSPSPRDS